MDILKILGNDKRRSILKMLVNKSVHISALARELNISTPVAMKHVNLLESANLVERTDVGNSVLITIKEDTIELLRKLESIIDKPTIIKAEKGETIHDVLKRQPEFITRKWPGTDQEYIYSIDGVKGYYIFHVNGRLPNKSIDKLKIENDIVIEFQKLIPVIGRRLEIKLEK